MEFLASHVNFTTYENWQCHRIYLHLHFHRKLKDLERGGTVEVPLCVFTSLANQKWLLQTQAGTKKTELSNLFRNEETPSVDL
jgi:hypothetical protein